MDQLTDDQAAILDFERQWFRHRGHKEDAILETFEWSTTRYYAVLNALIDSEVALAADPMLVRHLRKMRSARKSARIQSSRPVYAVPTRRAP